MSVERYTSPLHPRAIHSHEIRSYHNRAVKVLSVMGDGHVHEEIVVVTKEPPPEARYTIRLVSPGNTTLTTPLLSGLSMYQGGGWSHECLVPLTGAERLHKIGWQRLIEPTEAREMFHALGTLDAYEAYVAAYKEWERRRHGDRITFTIPQQKTAIVAARRTINVYPSTHTQTASN